MHLSKSPSSSSVGMPHPQCPYHGHHHHHYQPSPLPPPHNHHHHHHHHQNTYEEPNYHAMMLPMQMNELIDYRMDSNEPPPPPINTHPAKPLPPSPLPALDTQHSSYSNHLDFSNCCCCCFLCCCNEERKARCLSGCNKNLTEFTRCFLIIPNFLFLVFGCVILVLGLWLKSEKDSYFYSIIINRIPVSSLLTYDNFPLLVIIVASCVLLLSFLGCCGACAESVCFLCLYTTFLILIVVMEISLGIIAYAMREQLHQRLDATLQQQISLHYNFSSELFSFTSFHTSPPSSSMFEIFATKSTNENHSMSSHLSTAWDQMQTQFSCCGSRGPQDYMGSVWSSNVLLKVPPSCCAMAETTAADWLKKYKSCQTESEYFFKQKDASSSAKTTSLLNTEGCSGILKNILETNIHILFVVVTCVITLQVIDFIFACMLLKLFRKKMMEMSWYGENEID